MNLHPYTDPILAALPAILPLAVLIAAGYAAHWLQQQKSASVRLFGKMLETACGQAYGFMALRSGGLGPQGLLDLEKQAVGQAVDGLKQIAAAQNHAVKLDDATLATMVQGGLGKLMAVDPTVTVLPGAKAPVPTAPGGIPASAIGDKT